MQRRRESSERAAKLQEALMLVRSLWNRALGPRERQALDQITLLLRELEAELEFATPFVPAVLPGL